MQINLTDKSFKAEKAVKCRLSVQVDTDGLTFCIYDPDRQQLVVFKKALFEKYQLLEDMLNNIAGIFVSDELLDLSFQSVAFIYYSQQSTLIPDSYFNRQYLEEYFGFNHSLESSDKLFCNFISPLQAWNVFAVPSAVVELINSQFDSMVFAHQATPFLWQAAGQGKNTYKYTINTGINQGFFDISVFCEGKLLLYNTFQYANETDLLYFIFYIFKQLGIDVMNATLVISGEMGGKLVYFDTLKQYIPNIVYAKAPANVSLAPALFSVSVPKYLNVLSLHQCVSLEESTREG